MSRSRDMKLSVGEDLPISYLLTVPILPRPTAICGFNQTFKRHCLFLTKDACFCPRCKQLQNKWTWIIFVEKYALNLEIEEYNIFMLNLTERCKNKVFVNFSFTFKSHTEFCDIRDCKLTGFKTGSGFR